MYVIDAKGLYYRELNQKIKEAVAGNTKEIVINNVNGQYYIADGLKGDLKIIINGVPGNDLGAFLDGPTIIVNANGQDNIGNTMNNGKIVVHGNAGDVLGYGMRGGKIFIKGDVGYRIGIHMKGYLEQIPVLIAGGNAGDFFGEYMAGGIMILLGLNTNGTKPLTGDYFATGMHGGVIYLRGEIDKNKCGAEVGIVPLTDEDNQFLKTILKEYSEDFSIDFETIFSIPFTKIIPLTTRPYGNLYTY